MRECSARTGRNNRNLKRQYRARNEHRSLGYIGAISTQLARMARADGFETLASLLEMAALEAATTSKNARRDADMVFSGQLPVPAQSDEANNDTRSH